jgi:hypothetical protein
VSTGLAPGILCRKLLQLGEQYGRLEFRQPIVA